MQFDLSKIDLDFKNIIFVQAPHGTEIHLINGNRSTMFLDIFMFKDFVEVYLDKLYTEGYISNEERKVGKCLSSPLEINQQHFDEYIFPILMRRVQMNNAFKDYIMVINNIVCTHICLYVYSMKNKHEVFRVKAVDSVDGCVKIKMMVTLISKVVTVDCNLVYFYVNQDKDHPSFENISLGCLISLIYFYHRMGIVSSTTDDIDKLYNEIVTFERNLMKDIYLDNKRNPIMELETYKKHLKDLHKINIQLIDISQQTISLYTQKRITPNL